MRRYSAQIFGQPVVEKKPRKRIASDTPTEAVEQRMVAHYLDLRKLLWLHVPNEGKRNPVTGAILRGLGLKRGAPDVLIFTPPPRMHGIVGLAIEMKRCKPHHSSVSDEQKAWLAALSEAGWRTYVAYGAADAIRFVQEYYGG